MLECRGYEHVVSKCTTVSDILGYMKRDESIVIGRGCNHKDDIHIFFHLENKIGIKYMRSILEKFNDEQCIICRMSIEGPTTFTRKDARDYDNIVQFPTFKELFNDLSKHNMVPFHRLLTKSEKEELGTKYSIKNDSQWPQLMQKDPVMQLNFLKNKFIY